MASFETRPVWVHALSVGEVLAAVPLVETIKRKYPHRPLVFSVSTLTGHGIAERALKNGIDALFYFPYDFLWSVRRMIQKVNPAVFFLVECDLWPNCLHEMKRQKRPVILVNGRISPRSFRGYKRFSFLMRAVFSWLSVICVQSKLDAKRFELIGASPDKICITGNIKFDQSVYSVSDADLARMRKTMRMKPGQKVLLAGSTHEGEEAVLLDMFFRLKKECEQTILVVVPRDPERARIVRHLVSSLGGSAATLSELEFQPSIGPKEVVVVDTMGALSLLYAMADIAFVGGSLVKSGGHNPLEPAAYAKPIIFGPDMSDFSSVAEMLVENGGAIQIEDGRDLLSAIKGLLDHDNRAEVKGRRALEVFQRNKGAVEKTIRVSEPFLKP
jgi:3-deoxy-D-manno-octulosonic-acid transferase